MEASDTFDQTDGMLQDGTLGGYLEAHDRPPSFEGSDGHPYTVAVEIEKVGDLKAPFGAYLVFPRWAINGLGIVGHLQTPLLSRGGSRQDVMDRVAALTLVEVKELLEEAIQQRGERAVPW